MTGFSGHYDAVKVFTATKAHEREFLGQEITLWIAGPGASYIIAHKFHGLTSTLFLQTHAR